MFKLNQRIILFPLCVGMLSSCGLFIVDDAPFIAKEATIYDLRGLTNGDQVEIKDAYYASYYVLQSDDGLIPYVSLNDYSVWMSRYFDDRVFSTLSYNGRNPVWQVYLEGEKPNTNPTYIFFVIIDVMQNSFYMGGSLYSALTKNIAESKSTSISIGMKSSRAVYEEGRSYSVYSFAEAKHGKKWYHGDFYLPLGLFEASIGQTCDIYHFHDYDRFFAYDDPAELTLKNTYYATKAIDIGSHTREFNDNNGMPLSLREYERDVFYFVFENRYGLKEHKNIDSMSSYFKSLGVDDLLLSSSSEDREKGFLDAINSFEDLHTSVAALSSWWGDTLEGFTRSKTYQKRVEAYQTLQDKRADAFGEEPIAVQYHEDLAYIYMKGFEGIPNAYKEDGVTLVDNIAELDTYFYMIDKLNKIKEHGGIKDVVIDLSTNGGGYVSTMMKIVTLLSKENTGHFGTFESKKDYLDNTYVKVDSNMDGLYDETDVYGNDFDFYILTSLCSYSSGNAMPFYARKHGYAKIIGENSGGGECTVERVSLPSGRRFNFSTSHHVVYIEGEGNQYIGAEAGAGIDLEIDYDHFFDLPYIKSRIQSANSN